MSKAGVKEVKAVEPPSTQLARLLVQLENEEKDARETIKAIKERLTALRVAISSLAHDVASGQGRLDLEPDGDE